MNFIVWTGRLNKNVSNNPRVPVAFHNQSPLKLEWSSLELCLLYCVRTFRPPLGGTVVIFRPVKFQLRPRFRKERGKSTDCKGHCTSRPTRQGFMSSLSVISWENSGAMDFAHTKTTQEVLGYFNVDEEYGLSDDQVRKNLEKYGRNGKLIWKARKFWFDLFKLIVSRGKRMRRFNKGHQTFFSLP